jgi:hypothetical protein
MRFACCISKGVNTQSESLTMIDFQQQQCLLGSIPLLSYTYIVYLVVALIENLTKTPLPAAHVNSWFIPSHNYMSGRTGFYPLDILNEKLYQLIKLQTITIKNSHSTELCHKLRVLTVFRFSNLVLADAEFPWYWKQFWLLPKYDCKSWGKQELSHERILSYQVGSQYPQFVAEN